MKTSARYVSYTRRDGQKVEGKQAGYILHCSICGTVMFSRRFDTRYCSGACRQKAYRMRRRMARRAASMADTIRQLRLALS